MSRRFAPLYLCLGAQLVTGGCASQGAQASPGTAVAAYAWALQHDPNAAYEMLSEAQRAEMSRERFSSLLEAAPDEVYVLPEAEPRVEAKMGAARWAFSHESAVFLTLERGDYVVTDGVLEAVTADTPLKGVYAFRRGLIAALAASSAMGLSLEATAETRAQIRAILEDSQSDADLRVEVTGDEAVVHTPRDRKLILKRQGGRWRVHSVLHAEER